MDIESLKEIKKDLYNLDNQIEGAIYMLDEEDPTRSFLQYLQRCMIGMHDKIGWELKTNKNNPPNCS
jgi:hypothetical protein